MKSVSLRELRDRLGQFATGVCVVTTRTADGRDVGLTVNSFVPVSLDPPLVAWNLVSSSGSLEAFRYCRHFAVSVLACSQESVARRLPTPGVDDKVAGAPVSRTAAGPLIVSGATATFVCECYQSSTIGDHMLIVGKVSQVGSAKGDPLVFNQGRFRILPGT